MSPSEIKLWAKEEILSAVDKHIDKLKKDPVNGTMSLDEENALKLQRDRVAKLLGFF